MERKYKTPAAFARAVDKYFDAIRVVRPLIREEIDYQQTEDGSYTVRLDQYGHPAKKYVRQIAADGKPAEEEIWIKKPSIAGLCVYLKIHRSTWSEYAKRGICRHGGARAGARGGISCREGAGKGVERRREVFPAAQLRVEGAAGNQPGRADGGGGISKNDTAGEHRAVKKSRAEAAGRGDGGK